MIRLVPVLVLVAACNAVHGLDETVIVNRNPRVLVLDNSASPVDLVDLPVLVLLDPDRIEYDEVGDPVTDLRFADASTGEDLAFEIEQWSPGGVSAVWVEVARLPARAAHRIHMHYGPEARGTARPGDVWSAYAFAFHARADRPESSVGAYRSAPLGATAGAGAIAEAARFTGGTQRLEFAGDPILLDGWDRFTIELWLYADYAATADVDPRHFIFESGAIGAWLSRVDASATHVRLDVRGRFEPNLGTFDPIFLPIRRWTHLAIAFDGTIVWTYRDGVFANAESLDTSTRLAASALPLVVGSTMEVMHGLIDEVRVSDRFHDGTWINAQYLSMTGRLVRVLAPGED